MNKIGVDFIADSYDCFTSLNIMSIYFFFVWHVLHEKQVVHGHSNRDIPVGNSDCGGSGGLDRGLYP